MTKETCNVLSPKEVQSRSKLHFKGRSPEWGITKTYYDRTRMRRLLELAVLASHVTNLM